jgi:hypothetical protein
MVRRARILRITALGVCISLLPGFAAAQDGLRAPTIAASAAAAADWASTYYALTHFRVREMNPILSPLQDKPGRMVSMGALIDVGIVSGWNLGIGRRNERVAAAGLWAMAAFRGYLAIHNLRNTRRAERREPSVPVIPERPATLDASMRCVAPLTAQACAAASRTVR